VYREPAASSRPLTPNVEIGEKVPKQVLGKDAEKSDFIECATITYLQVGKSQETSENVALSKGLLLQAR
jgi:hypothetical protein